MFVWGGGQPGVCTLNEARDGVRVECAHGHQTLSVKQRMHGPCSPRQVGVFLWPPSSPLLPSSPLRLAHPSPVVWGSPGLVHRLIGSGDGLILGKGAQTLLLEGRHKGGGAEAVETWCELSTRA